MLWPLSMARAVPFAATSICPLSSIRGRLCCPFLMLSGLLCWYLGVGGAMYLLWSTVTCIVGSCWARIFQPRPPGTKPNLWGYSWLRVSVSPTTTSPTPRPGSYIFSWEPGRESAPGQNPRSKSEASAEEAAGDEARVRCGCGEQPGGVGVGWGGGRGTGQQKGLTLQVHSPPSEPHFGSLASKRGITH